jgi:hypothetical protein
MNDGAIVTVWTRTVGGIAKIRSEVDERIRRGLGKTPAIVPQLGSVVLHFDGAK